jgi:hypothetical protein
MRLAALTDCRARPRAAFRHCSRLDGRAQHERRSNGARVIVCLDERRRYVKPHLPRLQASLPVPERRRPPPRQMGASAPAPCCAAGNPQGALEPTRRMLRAFLVSRWFSANAKARPSCSARTHGAVALVHRSGHPFASHAEKLASNFLIGCQASKPHPFARVVHAFLVGDHGGPPRRAASQHPAPGLGTRAHVRSFMTQRHVVAFAERCSGA